MSTADGYGLISWVFSAFYRSILTDLTMIIDLRVRIALGILIWFFETIYFSRVECDFYGRGRNIGLMNEVMHEVIRSDYGWVFVHSYYKNYPIKLFKGTLL